MVYVLHEDQVAAGCVQQCWQTAKIFRAGYYIARNLVLSRVQGCITSVY